MRLLGVVCLLLVAFLAACGDDDDTSGNPTPASIGSSTSTPEELTVTSNGFTRGARIPIANTCDGDNISPDLQWSTVPDGTESLVVIVDDPDAGGFVHWIVYGIPGNTIGLPPGITDQAGLADGSIQGANGRREIGYFGPCPPSGTHTYVFTVYALDTQLSLEPGAAARDLLGAIDGHVLASGRLTGIYGG